MKTPLLRYIPLLALTGVLSLAADPELKPLPDVFDIASVQQPPVPIAQEGPRYTNMFGMNGTEPVTVEFIIDTKGNVRDAEVVSAKHAEFGQAALLAIRKWKFKPAKLDGRSVNVRARQVFEFTFGDAADLVEKTAISEDSREAKEDTSKVKISRKVTHHEKPKDALIVKGLFIGMDIEDAASRLKEVLAESASGMEDISVTKDEFGDGYYAIFGFGGRIDANSNGEVISIYMDEMTVGSIFGADKMVPTEFVQQFSEAYKLGVMRPVKYDRIVLLSNVSFVGLRCTRPDGVRVTLGMQCWNEKTGSSDTKTVEIEKVMNSKELKAKFN